MKKFLFMFTCLMVMVMSLSSCGSTYNVTVNYDVCYPDGTNTYTFDKVYKNSTEPTISCFSINGTNYLSIHSVSDDLSKNPKGKVIISTTAPIRLNGYNIENIKRGNTIKYKDDVY